MKVTLLCDASTTADEGIPTVIGTKLLVGVIVSVIEAIFVFYLLYEFCKKKQYRAVNKSFQMTLTLYHVSFLSLLCVFNLVYLPMIFEYDIFTKSNNSKYKYDFSSAADCYLGYHLSVIPLVGCYLAVLLFWLFRLKLVFNDSIYQISNKLYILLTLWIIVVGVVGFLLVMTAMILTIFTTETEEENKVYCLQKIAIVDFIPYIRIHNYNYDKNKNNHDSYSYKINNFYSCQEGKYNSNLAQRSTFGQLIWTLTDIPIYVAFVSIPILNSLLFFFYVKKMNQIRHDMNQANLSVHTCASNTKNINNNNNIEQLKRLGDIYRTAVIGICSISTTLVTFCLYFINGYYWSSLYFIDLMVNGYLMIVVFKFASWMCPKCCTKMITHRVVVVATTNA